MSRIKTNVESLIARRACGVNNKPLNETLERLRSGLHINRGKDAPIGLIASDLQEASSLNAPQVARENETAAGSAIRDADFAIETSHLTRARILINS